MPLFSLEITVKVIKMMPTSFKNSIEPFSLRLTDHPLRLAVQVLGEKGVSYAEMASLAVRVQQMLREQGIQPGDSVLVMEPVALLRLATMIGILGLGAKIIFLEPEIPISQINEFIRKYRPRFFLSHPLRFLWALQVPEVRKISRWISTKNICRYSSFSQDLEIEKNHPDEIATVTCCSSFQGRAKTVIHSHAALLHQMEILSKYMEPTNSKSILCSLPNSVFQNLALGSPSFLMPPQWTPKLIKSIESLNSQLLPTQLICGPAFLRWMIQFSQLKTLQNIYVGSALTDCQLYQEGFNKWPQANWFQLYGDFEVEPVTVTDAKKSVRKSMDYGFYSALFLGRPLTEIQHRFSDQGLWVSGPHVCVDHTENSQVETHYKWHLLEDRIKIYRLDQSDDEDTLTLRLKISDGWWYWGSMEQLPEDFLLEQEVYQSLNSSSSFIHRDANKNELTLFGENVTRHTQKIRNRFPVIKNIREVGLVRDKRHRARIDRKRTLRAVS